MCNQVSKQVLFEQCLYREDKNSTQVKSAEWSHTENFEFVCVKLYEYDSRDIILEIGARFDGKEEVWEKSYIDECTSEAIRFAIRRLDHASELLYKHAEQAMNKAEA